MTRVKRKAQRKNMTGKGERQRKGETANESENDKGISDRKRDSKWK